MFRRNTEGVIMFKKTFALVAAITLILVMFAGCGSRLIVSGDIRIDEKNTQEFSAVSVSTSLSKIEFVESDQYGFEIFVPERFAPEWDISNGRLTIIENTNNFSINLSVTLPNYFIKVYYPAGADFSDITLKTSSGNVRVPQVNAGNLDITTSSGDIDAKAVGFTRASMRASSGEITFAGSGGSVDIETSSGNIRADISNVASIDAAVSSGNITINGTGDSAAVLSARTMSGNIKVDGAIWQSITTRTSSGDTTIKGALLGVSSVDTSSGSVNISVIGDPSQYGYTLTPSSGSIHWNGEKMSKPAVSTGSFENHIVVSTSSGSIRVDFI